MDADHVHCFSVHYQFMQNYAGQQTLRYHIDHTYTSTSTSVFTKKHRMDEKSFKQVFHFDQQQVENAD